MLESTLQNTTCTAFNVSGLMWREMSALTQEEVASSVPLLLDQCVFVLVNLCASTWAFHIPTPCLLQHRTRPGGLVTANPSNFVTRPGYFGCYCSLNESRLCTTATACLCRVSQTEVCHSGRTTSCRTATPWSQRQVKTSAQTTACSFLTNANCGWGRMVHCATQNAMPRKARGTTLATFNVQWPGASSERPAALGMS